MSTGEESNGLLTYRLERLESEIKDLRIELEKNRIVSREESEKFREMSKKNSHHGKFEILYPFAFFVGAFGILALFFYGQIRYFDIEEKRLNSIIKSEGRPILGKETGEKSAAPRPNSSSNSPHSLLPETAEATYAVIEQFINQSAGRNIGSMSTTLSLSGLEVLINTLKEGGMIAGDAASSIVGDLRKQIIPATVDVTKEAAKGIIAKYLGSNPESNLSRSGSTQHVLVNIYGVERPIPTQPARKRVVKPLPICPTTLNMSNNATELQANVQLR
jgi:hypothetical protein